MNFSQGHISQLVIPSIKPFGFQLAKCIYICSWSDSYMASSASCCKQILKVDLLVWEINSYKLMPICAQPGKCILNCSLETFIKHNIKVVGNIGKISNLTHIIYNIQKLVESFQLASYSVALLALSRPPLLETSEKKDRVWLNINR